MRTSAILYRRQLGKSLHVTCNFPKALSGMATTKGRTSLNVPYSFANSPHVDARLNAIMWKFVALLKPKWFKEH